MEQRTKNKEQKNKRRYNLHYKLRKKGFTLITRTKTFEIGQSDKIKYEDDLTAKNWIDELVSKYQYATQLIIE